MIYRFAHRHALAALVTALLLPGAAFAHAALEGSVPAEGAVVAGPVEAVELRFADGIRLTRVEVEGPDGTAELEVEALEDAVFVAPVDLGAGAYELRYIGLGPDGHPMKGGFGFEVE
jgi:methionine-rich copper-binding protein CopC